MHTRGCQILLPNGCAARGDQHDHRDVGCRYRRERAAHPEETRGFEPVSWSTTAGCTPVDEDAGGSEEAEADFAFCPVDDEEAKDCGGTEISEESQKYVKREPKLRKRH
jgi:hypothetical protein